MLVDDTLIIAFYDKLIPAGIFNGITFEKWHKEATASNPKLLYLRRDDLMRHEAAGVTTDVFPKTLSQAGTELGLSYHFEPGSPRDGVTLTVPLFALNQISADRSDWLVPGMLKEKVQLLIKSLPQKIRRHCVPLPEYAAGFCSRADFGKGNFLETLMADIREQTGLVTKPSDFKQETIPAHLTMNFKIVDEHGRQLEMGRNLAALRIELGPLARESFQKLVQTGGVAGYGEGQLPGSFNANSPNNPNNLNNPDNAIKSANVTHANKADGSAASDNAAIMAKLDKLVNSGRAGNSGKSSHQGKSSGASSLSDAAQMIRAKVNANPNPNPNPAHTPAPSAATGTGATATPPNANVTDWTFGELPELLEISQGKQTLIGYPGLVDKTTHCQLQVFDDPDVAARSHRIGLRRLFALQLRDQLKFLEKNIPGLQQMGMQFMSLGSQEELRTQLIDLAFERAFLQHPLPTNADEFMQRKEQGRPRLNLLATEIARLAGVILAEFHGLPKKLQGTKSPATSDMLAQLQKLVGKRFITDTPYTQLVHFPRYLKAISVRLDKLRGDPVRDARLMQDWNDAASGWQRTSEQIKNSDQKMQDYRWMLEELRVSLFAQELKTPMPVSAKRLQKVWESMQR